MTYLNVHTLLLQEQELHMQIVKLFGILDNYSHYPFDITLMGHVWRHEEFQVNFADCVEDLNSQDKSYTEIALNDLKIYRSPDNRLAAAITDQDYIAVFDVSKER